MDQLRGLRSGSLFSAASQKSSETQFKTGEKVKVKSSVREPTFGWGHAGISSSTVGTVKGYFLTFLDVQIYLMIK